MLAALDEAGVRDDTLVWMTTDNGPEVNCKPEGFCKGTPLLASDVSFFYLLTTNSSTRFHSQSSTAGTQQRPVQAPGSAGPLRGRKRDIYEGGHRVPGIVAWPAVVKGPARTSWDTVVTMDFLPTVMEVLNVSRPASQAGWGFDGVSIMPILRDASFVPPERGIGWWYNQPTKNVNDGWGYRHGKWKYVVGSVSCQNADCKKPQLYDLSVDLSEKNDLATTFPGVLAAIEANFTAWYDSVQHSRTHEAKCGGSPPKAPTPPPKAPTPPPPPTPAPAPRSDCTWRNSTGLEGRDIDTISDVASKELCCSLCWGNPNCRAADYNDLKGTNVCHLKSEETPETRHDGSISCVPQR